MRNGLSAFADVAFPIAVPRPTPYLYAREAFLYLVSFSALYVSATSFVILVFGLIDHAFPDALDYRDSYPSSGEGVAIASVIVASPFSCSCPGGWGARRRLTRSVGNRWSAGG